MAKVRSLFSLLLSFLFPPRFVVPLVLIGLMVFGLVVTYAQDVTDEPEPTAVVTLAPTAEASPEFTPVPTLPPEEDPTELPEVSNTWYDLLISVTTAIGEALAPYAAYAISLVVVLTQVFKRFLPDLPEGAPGVFSVVLSGIASVVGIIIMTNGKVELSQVQSFLEAIAGTIPPLIALFFGTSLASSGAYVGARKLNIPFLGKSRSNPDDGEEGEFLSDEEFNRLKKEGRNLT